MPSRTPSAYRVLLRSLPLILFAWAPPQSTAPNPEVPRIHLNQDQLCCLVTNAVEPIYPKEARLAHREGVVKLVLIVATDGSSIADLQAVSGDPVLLDSTMKAVRQWRFTIGGFVGKPEETEIPITFTFKIEDPPKPAYLHLTNGNVIRVDEVREFTDGIEYTVGHRTHRIAPGTVTDIDGCAHVVFTPAPKKGDCIPRAVPYFDMRAIPLLPSESAPVAQAHRLNRIRVNGDVQKTKLVHVVSPMYPAISERRVDGTVVLRVIIAKNGAVNSARYVSGPYNLEDSAVRAVLQWRYEPTLVSGAPVEVDTTVSVAFPRP
jgi:TonB family protein